MTVIPGVPGDRDRIATDAFDVGVVLTGIDGVLEIVGGLFLIVVPLATIQHFLIWATGKELSEEERRYSGTGRADSRTGRRYSPSQPITHW